MINNATPDDAARLCAIYNEYVANTTISFELDAVDAAQMASRIATVQQAGLPWLVCCIDDQIAGYAYASPWKPRPAYRHSVETSVYLDQRYRGQQIGSRLYEQLLDTLKQAGMHAAIGGVALPNAASIALHEKMGFRKIAHFEQVGYKFGQWIDVGYWQKIL